ncbi:MAG: NADH-quinone oxidoreductase subunit L [Eggerthellaceae bacterium]|nr:NADH-quinone oxidoreductase subunit L [Eggerthellaceae bacterium]
MQLISFLILFPLVIAVLLLFVKADWPRNIIVGASAAVIAVASIVLAVQYIGAPWIGFEFSSEIADYIGAAIGVAIAVTVICFGVKYKNYFAVALAAIQVVGSLVFEFGFAHNAHVAIGLYVDSLSIVMALIIGVIGSGICVYALGYMMDFQKHLDDHGEEEGLTELQRRDRRPTFFALMFVFLSAMYVIVFSNNMSWMFTGWEVTTVCSFLLIAYTRTEEAVRNAFRQIIMNIAGGIGFLVALFLAVILANTLSFERFVLIGLEHPEIVSVAVCALAFAGLTKSAQMPFHTWLLGAMVAPTPTSALLHSSTMVKAGVFLLIKLAPLFMVCTVPASMVILVGGFTFMLCSFMAISQSNAKRVLAYSTIANLGLIVACAGVGSPEAIWAATLLVIFHAAAKSLLFLCVGTAEHHIGSRDIEDMDLLFERMPRLARFMMLGIMCMFIAPFGMLIAKWATLVSFVESGQLILILLLAFGSGATFMFWAKWLGKLSGIAGSPENVELTVHPSEWISLVIMACIAVVACIALPVVSNAFVEPYIVSVFGVLGRDVTIDNLWISSILAIFVFVVLFGGVRSSKKKRVNAYLSGVSVDDASRTYRNSLSGESVATSRNLYLDSYFGEDKMRPIGEALCGAIIVVALLASGLVVPPIL